MKTPPKKIVILTLPLGNNYGGLMQAYALQRVVSGMGYDAVTDRYACKNKSWKSYFLWLYLPVKYFLLRLLGKKMLDPGSIIQRNENLSHFINENIRTVDFFKGHKRPTRNDIENYDVFLVGSDQVWRKKYVNIQSYLLSFLDHIHDKRFFSYGASFGCDNVEDWTNSDKKVAKRMLSQFAAISVREKSGVEILQKEFGVHALCVLDPTMLLSIEDYLYLDGVNNIKKEKKMLYCYILDLTDDKKDLIRSIKEERGLENILLISPKIDKIKKDLPNNFKYPSIAEWLSGFRDADFVFTDSFHGSALHTFKAVGGPSPVSAIITGNVLQRKTFLFVITGKPAAGERGLLRLARGVPPGQKPFSLFAVFPELHAFLPLCGRGIQQSSPRSTTSVTL